MKKQILNKTRDTQKAIKTVFGDFIYKIFAVSFALNFIALDYIILSQSTTFRILASQNTAFYNWTSLVLSLIIGVFFGISLAMLIYVVKKQKESAKDSAQSTFFGMLFGAVASGCPVCGAWLLPIFGIAGSLAVFPFQGLEIKVFAVILLALSIIKSSSIILGVCSPKNTKKKFSTTMAIILALVVIIFLFPSLPQRYKMNFQRVGVSAATQEQIVFEANLEKLSEQVNPKEGFAINASYGNIGYRLIEDGVIDLDKFKAVYDRAGSPLTKEQLKIFDKEGLNKPIIINRENSYFLLNLFWAFGLANENLILTEGQITKYGSGKVGSFASTGGWSIAKKPLSEYFAKSKFAVIDEEQQKRVQKVAENVYRPCCGNSTAFPDCNHGMALLGVLELMASNGASEDEMFEAAKYFSAFWFPQQALDIAAFFMVTENKDFKNVDSRVFVSEQFFSGRGWSQIKSRLESELGVSEQVISQGGGCGV